MEKENMKTIGQGIVLVSVLIWLVAIFMKPFGAPLLTWHLVNGIVVLVGILIWISSKGDDYDGE